MKPKVLSGIGALLVALLVVGAVIVPAVSAASQTGAGIDPDQYAIPDLKVNRSLETIAISGMLSPETELNEAKGGTYGIPSGSIIVHVADGTTRVFAPDGNQLLSISDERSGKIPTPAGVEKSCTKVHQLPNDSKVYYHGDKIVVLDSAGERILVVIDENTPSTQREETLSWTGHDWVESAEDNDVDYITECIAYWRVPTSPPSLESDEMIYLFNSITGVSDSKKYILQPVLRYYGANQKWEGQAWAYDVDGDDHFTGPFFDTTTRHTMEGRIYWSNDLQLWSITLYDRTTGEYSSVSVNCIVPQINSRVAHVLEGYYLDDNTDVPGDTLFYDMEYRNSGTPMSVDLRSWYSTNVPSEIMQYCWVEIIQNPSQVRLHTYN